MNKRWIFLLLVFGSSCDPVAPFSDIPYIPFDDIVVNTNLPKYSSLRIDGGVVAIDGGIRGIYLYRENSTQYHAFERNCSYLPNEACATVDLDPSSLFMRDPCCNSTFAFPSGLPTGGPAIYSLRKYLVFVDGDNVTITDKVLN